MPRSTSHGDIARVATKGPSVTVSVRVRDAPFCPKVEHQTLAAHLCVSIVYILPDHPGKETGVIFGCDWNVGGYGTQKFEGKQKTTTLGATHSLTALQLVCVLVPEGLCSGAVRFLACDELRFLCLSPSRGSPQQEIIWERVVSAF